MQQPVQPVVVPPEQQSVPPPTAHQPPHRPHQVPDQRLHRCCRAVSGNIWYCIARSSNCAIWPHR